PLERGGHPPTAYGGIEIAHHRVDLRFFAHRLKRIVDFFRLTPVLGVRGEGKLTAVGMLTGRRRALEKYKRFVLKRVQPGVTYRLAVGHTNCEDDASDIYDTLINAIPNLESHYLCRIGSALGAHTGANSLVVGLQERPAAVR
ncbi:MAG: DegV family protein, partial [Pseudomonadota bacterium]